MPAKSLDITGERYGRLVAICSTGRKRGSNYIWQFKCDCGNEVELVSGDVRSGSSSSCGCFAREECGKRMREVAVRVNPLRAIHSMTGSRTFVSWDSMKQRCLNPSHNSYDYYGGRGIKVCTAWLDSFEAFLADMCERPKGMTLDRIDPDGNYEPGNCRWATAKDQGNNKRSSRFLTHAGKTQTVAQWADEIGISRQSLRYRLESGWSTEEALTMKINHGNGWVREVR